MRCFLHAKYTGDNEPRPTMVHPEGCPTCWQVYDVVVEQQRAKQRAPKQLPTVNVELALDEARVVVLALHQLLEHSNPRLPEVATLKSFLAKLALTVKEGQP